MRLSAVIPARMEPDTDGFGPATGWNLAIDGITALVEMIEAQGFRLILAAPDAPEPMEDA